jgi:hypothetical protein
VARHPELCLLVSVAFMLFFGAIGFVLRPEDLPDFSAADKGFDTRGSDLSGAHAAMQPQLQRAVCRGDLTSSADGAPSLERFYWEDDEDLSDKYVGTIAACGADYCCPGGAWDQERCPREDGCPAAPPAPATDTCGALDVVDGASCAALCQALGFDPASTLFTADPVQCYCQELVVSSDTGLEEPTYVAKCRGARRAAAAPGRDRSARRTSISRLAAADSSSPAAADSSSSPPAPARRRLTDSADRMCTYARDWWLTDEREIEVVFTATGDDLMNAGTLKAICAHDAEIAAMYRGWFGQAPDSWVSTADDTTCRGRNLGAYIAAYYDR